MLNVQLHISCFSPVSVTGFITWEEHGGDHFWLFQGVNNAALEGLADGRLQVAGGEKKQKQKTDKSQETLNSLQRDFVQQL